MCPSVLITKPVPLTLVSLGDSPGALAVSAAAFACLNGTAGPVEEMDFFAPMEKSPAPESPPSFMRVTQFSITIARLSVELKGNWSV